MQSSQLLQNKKEKFYFSFFILIAFLFNLLLHYNNYKDITKEELFRTDGVILNIYKKEKFQTLKIQTEKLTLFTSVTLDEAFNKLDNINLFLVVKDLSFVEYLQGSYLKSFNIDIINKEKTFKKDIYNNLNNQHSNKKVASIFSALFLAVPIESELREFFAAFGISHLIAISGFHLALISGILYFIFNIVYSPVHQKFIPYRNKRFDILILVGIVLFLYLLFTNNTPSLLRSFVMFLIGLFLVRNNIKLLSFETLLLTVVSILALFPELLFSLSLWFSVSGVFYIYLFINYFKDLNKYLQLIVFNVWIYLALNPIVHYFFGTTAYEQLYSPILTILFTLFYPLTLFFHIIGYGGVLDSYLLDMISLNIKSFEAFTPVWFFILYLVVSFASIVDKKAFFLLHFLFIGFNIYLYL